MSILVGRETRLVVQGITGREGEFHSRAMLEYGTPLVAGMTPGKEYNCIVGPGYPYYMIGGDVFVLAKTDDPEQKAAQVLLAKT